MSFKSFLISIFVLSLLSGCNLTASTSITTPLPTVAPTLEFSEPTQVQSSFPTQPGIVVTSTPLSSQQQILDLATAVINLLKAKDMAALSKYVHPLLGLRFSPYAYIKDSDQVFTADQVAGLMSDTMIYTWGNYDGTGEPIEMPFADYYPRFVYDEDFANAPQIALNHRLGVSSSLDNNQEFYPNAMIVEFYFPGFDPQYEGLDWRSLRLVFMNDNLNWYLAGIVHDQWTS